MTVHAQFAVLIGNQDRLMVRRVRRMTSQTVQLLLGARVDDLFPHRVIVGLLHAVVAIHAQFHDIFRTQESLEIG